MISEPETVIVVMPVMGLGGGCERRKTGEDGCGAYNLQHVLPLERCFAVQSPGLGSNATKKSALGKFGLSKLVRN